MSQSNYSGSKGFKATAALSRGFLVKLVNGEVVVATAATDNILGIVENDVKAGQVASVRLINAQGTAQVKLGGTVSGGSSVLTSDGAGRAIASTAAAAGAVPSSRVVGLALEDGVSGDIVEIELQSYRV